MTDRIEISDGGTCYVGQTAVALMRLKVMVSGLRFEIRTNGMKICRGPSCWTLAKREFGLKGSREKVLADLEKVLAEAESRVPVVDKREDAND